MEIKNSLLPSLVAVWIINCMLAIGITINQVWIPAMNASDGYANIQSDPFDGTVMPIAFIPDWMQVENQNKTKNFSDIPIRDFIPIPVYDPAQLLDDSGTDRDALIARYTYIVPYMGSYRGNYEENDGSHLAVDIRAPIGTPVLAIANGIVVRTIEADSTGNKFVVIRHDGVRYDGKIQSLYSAYEHLSEITIPEGTRVKKGDMIGKVGITGITTTPHLHFQIDRAEAPFHPYWPFSSQDLQVAGLSFFDGVDAGLGKAQAEQYTINPMSFVKQYFSGNPQIAVQEKTPSITEKTTIASAVETIAPICVKKRFSDVDETTVFGEAMYAITDNSCLFQARTTFDARENISRKEALMIIMKSLRIQPMLGEKSAVLDVALDDPFQEYLVRAEQFGVIHGLYFSPENAVTKAEFVDMFAILRKASENPSKLPIFPDVDEENEYFQTIQNYGYITGAKGGRFYPDMIITRGVAMQILISAGVGQK